MLTSLVACLGKTNSACHRNLKAGLPRVERAEPNNLKITQRTGTDVLGSA